MTTSVYQRPMQPWPGLEPYSRQVHLPKSSLTLHLYDAGSADAPPLVLVHGLADEADTWRYLIPPLSAHHRVVAPDLPGFGRSDHPDRAYTLPFFQETVVELLEELELAPVTLVGHSLGGMISQSVALAHPARLQRLVLIGGSLVVHSRRVDLATLRFLVPGLGEWLYYRLRKDPEAAYQSLRPYYGDLDGLPEADREFLFERVNERVWSDGQCQAYLSTLRHLARGLLPLQRDLPERLAALAVPTLVIWGELDEMNSVENARGLVEIQPTARLVVVPGAGHNLQQEHPAAVLAAIE